MRIPDEDVQKVRALNEVSEAIDRAVQAVLSDEALGLDFPAHFALAKLHDIVRIALRTVVPPILEEQAVERAQAQDLLARANGLIQLLAWLHAEAAWRLQVAGEGWSRATASAHRWGQIRHEDWLQARRLHADLVVIRAEVDQLRGRHEAEVGATVTLLRNAAAEAVKHGDQDRADRFVISAQDHAQDGCPVPLAECNAVAYAHEALAEYRARDAAARPNTCECGHALNWHRAASGQCYTDDCPCAEFVAVEPAGSTR